MTTNEITVAVTIHLIIPAMGFGAYLLVCRRLFAQGASRFFLAQIFLLFACYGGLLLVLLTSLFWEWSGMASLGTLFLLFIAPLLLVFVIRNLRRLPAHSPAQRLAYRASIGYFVLLAGTVCAIPLIYSVTH